MLEFSAALSAARASLDLLKGAVAARDDAKIQAAIADMATRLTDATLAALSSAEKASSLQAQLQALQRDKEGLEAKLVERSMYELHEVRPGAFVYKLKAQAQGENPPHYLCQHCYDKGIKSILTTRADHANSLICKGSSVHQIVLRATRLDVSRMA
jgi:hypothetical protein